MRKRAIILAGGKGTRLKPYTISLPKPLVPVGDIPILEIIIRQLVKAGFSHITITLNHFADIIKAYFSDGTKWGIRIDYSFEQKPLSTMGPLSLLKDLPEHFLVMNGDILTDLDFRRFHDDHVAKDNLFTIAAHRRKNTLEYGVLHTNESNHLTGFEEKPTTSYLVSMGIYMASRRNLEIIPENTFFGFDHLMYKLIEDKNYATVYEFDGFWLDIGRPDDYEIAIAESSKRSLF